MSGARLRSRFGSVRAVVCVALAFHGLWVVAYFAAGHEARDFIKLGYRYVRQSTVSRVIRYDPSYRYPQNHFGAQGLGYDGQFYFYMAVDFDRARHYMDAPGYRYSRVLYPVAAGSLAAGQAGAVPYTLILVNLLAIGAGTLALATWLRRRGSPPAVALLYSLFPALLLAVQRDLAEPLAYALVAGGVLAFDFGGRRRLVWASVLFGLAGLTRQTTLVFPLAYALGMLRSGREPDAGRPNLRAGAFAFFSLLPFFVWTALLLAAFGDVSTGRTLDPVPFGGLISSGAWDWARQPPEALFLFLPGLLGTLACLRAGRAALRRPEVLCLIGNFVLFFVFGPTYTAYPAAARAAVGLVLAAVLCVPLTAHVRWRGRHWAWYAGALWLALLPVVAVYGFTDVRV
jgi:hypothetical protein